MVVVLVDYLTSGNTEEKQSTLTVCFCLDAILGLQHWRLYLEKNSVELYNTDNQRQRLLRDACNRMHTHHYKRKLIQASKKYTFRCFIYLIPHLYYRTLFLNVKILIFFPPFSTESIFPTQRLQTIKFLTY